MMRFTAASYLTASEGVRIPPPKVQRASGNRAAMIVLGILLAFYSSAFALDPSLDVNQYAHTTWKISEGFSKGVIWSIAQTPDGYLWLGTEFGILRFDGVRAVPWQPPAGESLPSNDVRSLLVARDGALWIGTYNGLVRWKEGKLTHYPELDGLIVEKLLEDREGTFWVVAGWTLSEARLCSISGGKTQCYGENGGPGSRVTTIYQDSKGTLWAGTMNGVWRWKPAPSTFYAMRGPEQRTYALLASDDGGILIARRDGITKLKDGRFEPYPLPAGLEFPPGKLLRDRDGALWIGALSDKGLLHVHQGKTDLFTPADGISGDLSGDSVRAMFEDREGNIWVSTGDGLDRFREFAFPTVSIQQGLSSRSVLSVVAGHDGNIWIGTVDGLNRWNKGLVTIFHHGSVRSAHRETFAGGFSAAELAEPGTTVREIFSNELPPGELLSLFEDNDGNLWVATVHGLAFMKAGRFFHVNSVPPGNVPSITGDRAGNVWVSHDRGLYHLSHGILADHIPWEKLGHREPAEALQHDAAQGGLWLGFRDGGVAFFKDREIHASYTGSQGLAEGMVHSFYRDGNGVLWTAVAGGLSRIQDGRILTLTERNGLPCNSVHWMMEDDAGSVWLYMACGLIRTTRSELDGWVANPKQRIHPTVFDTADGVKMHPTVSGYGPLISKAGGGKLWFVSSSGVSIIDPQHLHLNHLPPPVHIEQITADEKSFYVSNSMRLPARMRNMAIEYTALSLVAPEKMRFRYKLEGQNRNWHEVVNDREVQYTNLAPGNYRFRVFACNNSGMWSEEGATLDFVVLPAWYQTNWFRTACVAAFLALLWAAYQLRVRQLAAQFNMRLDERVQERTRIARDLHDTLLQSFHGLLMNLQTISRLMPRRPLEAQEKLERTIEQAEEAIVEGRDAVQGLRASTVETNNLARAISALGEEFTNDSTSLPAPVFRVAVEGPSYDLHPILRDEIYRIAAEALRNAFRHAQARQIEVEIRYGAQQFRLRVRDDGRGFDPKVPVSQGQKGHYGLPGMKERAKIAGGKLRIWSEVRAGTEVELEIPAGIVYAKASRRSWLSEKLAGKAGRGD